MRCRHIQSSKLQASQPQLFFPTTPKFPIRHVQRITPAGAMPGPNTANEDVNTPDTSSPTPDVIINRTNVTLARSERILQSWLRPATPADLAPAEETRLEDEELFNESSGVGAKTTTDDLDEFGLRRGKKASTDRLLEQLLGKKGAAAKRKKQDVEEKQMNSTGGKTGKTKALVQQPKEERKRAADSEADDEGGRAAAFTSRRPKNNESGPKQDVLASGTDVRQGQFGDVQLVRTDAMSPDDDGRDAHRSSEIPRKRKTNSYLDEVLAKSSKKRNKGKPQG